MGLPWGPSWVCSRQASHQSSTRRTPPCSSPRPEWPPSTTSADAPTSGINVDNEAQLVTSVVTATAAQDLLATTVPASDLIKRVTVTVPANTAILTVSFQDQTALGAQRGAQAFAQAYLDQRSKNAKAVATAQVQPLTDELTALTTALKNVTSQTASLPANSPDRAYADAQRAVLVNQIQNVNTQLGALKTLTITPGTIISAAQLPASPSQPITLLYLASGMMLGLLFGLALAIALHYRERRFVSDAASLEEFGVPVLSDLRLPSRERTLTLIGASSPAAREFGMLKNAVLTRLEHAPEVAVVGVASIVEGLTAAIITSSLATSLSGSERLLIHVIADPHSASRDLVGARHATSLADLAASPGNHSWLSVESSASYPDLRVVSAATHDPVGGPPTSYDRLRAVIGELRHAAGLVLVEAPDLTSSADGYAALIATDTVYLVVQTETTRVDQVRAAMDRLRQLDVPVAGFVLTSPTSKRMREAFQNANSRSDPSGGAAHQAQGLPETARLE